jgi:hypothetical protein
MGRMAFSKTPGLAQPNTQSCREDGLREQLEGIGGLGTGGGPIQQAERVLDIWVFGFGLAPRVQAPSALLVMVWAPGQKRLCEQKSC